MPNSEPQFPCSIKKGQYILVYRYKDQLQLRLTSNSYITLVLPLKPQKSCIGTPTSSHHRNQEHNTSNLHNSPYLTRILHLILLRLLWPSSREVLVHTRCSPYMGRREGVPSLLLGRVRPWAVGLVLIRVVLCLVAGLLSTSVFPGVSSTTVAIGVGPVWVTVGAFSRMCRACSSTVRTGRYKSAVVRSPVL